MISLFLFIFGLIIGSFLTAFTYRYPRNIPFVKGRSYCPKCKNKISWYDNIPVISYLFLGGKCRNCKKEIPIRYPLIEISTGLIFVLVGLNVFNLILAVIFISLFIIDFEHKILPDELIFIGIFVLILKYLFYDFGITTPLFSGFLAADLLLFLNLATRGKGMGLGDVKLAILIGMFIGLEHFLIWLFFSFVVGAIVGIMLIVLNKAKLKGEIAFGPFLIIGMVIANYFGNAFLRLIGF